MSEFGYEPLPSGGSHVRLLRVLRAPKNDSLCCEFETSSIGNPSRKKYEAVSYWWCTDARVRTIELERKAFKVTPIVEDILLRLRDERKDRLLWLDQICIDQSNTAEKNSQVNRMTQIFSEAETVIASLGPHSSAGLLSSEREGCQWKSLTSCTQSSTWSPQVSSEGNSGLSVVHWKDHAAINLITSMWGAIPKYVGVSLSAEDEECLHEFLRRPWFERIWVVQEVAAARKLVVVCGDKETDGKHFTRLHTRVLRRVRSETLRARLIELGPLLDYISSDALETWTKPELLTLLQRFRPWKATRPHDKVYALRGISKDGLHDRRLLPAYESRVEEVYRGVAEYMISRHGLSTVMTYACHETRPEPEGWSTWLYNRLVNRPSQLLPSWAPDWRVACSTYLPEAVTDSTLPRLTSHDNNSSSVWQLDLKTGSLSIVGFTIAIISSSIGDNIRLNGPDYLNALVTDLSYTLRCMSVYLAALAKSLTASSESKTYRLKKHDQVCLLQGSTGITILRPVNDTERTFTFVLQEHSKFAPISVGPLDLLDVDITMFEDSVFTRIAYSLSRYRGRASMYRGQGGIRAHHKIIDTEVFDII